MKKPGLFGIKHSNRDFTAKESWGKNQFNSSFPAALTAFIHSKGFDCKYLILSKKLKVQHSFLKVDQLFGQNPTSDQLFYAFETQYSPYQQLVVGTLPRVDLVTQSREKGTCLAAIEIKLTALPDNTTCDLEENKYGSEIVIRPDTIVYLACSIAAEFSNNRNTLKKIFAKKYSKIKDWTEGVNVQGFLPQMIKDINSICLSMRNNQSPLILQPIWKTLGKSPRLAKSCLDVFVWSNLAFTRLFVDATISEISKRKTKISRQSRTVIWLFKMLYDFAINGQINHKLIIDNLSYNTKNDKAFSSSGKVTHKYMKSNELTTPRIKKQDIKNIILGGAHNMLSPERRFDSIIFNSPDLFDYLYAMINTVDLFSGCGGLSLGFEKAGFNVLAAFDIWKPAVDIYRNNFDHPIYETDLSNQDAIEQIKTYKPNLIIGGPPCQDFSSAGKRDETLGRADLTISFAQIIKEIKPLWFLMENVARIEKSIILKEAITIFKESGYGLTKQILNASFCGVPQRRKRFFLIGRLNGKNNELDYYLSKNQSKNEMTLHDYFGDSLGLEFYYRHPRSYARRGIFSIYEPSPTVRGVNRPMPKTYKKHNGDKCEPSDKVRALTTIERSYIQTFPKDFKFEGTKSNLEQMIGNAVPVKLAEYVANCIKEFQQDFDNNKVKISDKFAQLELQIK